MTQCDVKTRDPVMRVTSLYSYSYPIECYTITYQKTIQSCCKIEEHKQKAMALVNIKALF